MNERRERPEGAAEQPQAGDPLRGAARLAVEATVGVAEVVEAVHLAIGGGPRALGRPFLAPLRLFTAPVYATIRGVTKLVGASVDLALRAVGPLAGEGARPERDAAIAALNGVLGDHLAASGNPLAIPMTLRHRGVAVGPDREALAAALPDARRRLLVLVHGCCLDDRRWSARGTEPAAAIAEELGFTLLHLRYNTGLHVATNGRAFSEALERLVEKWPVPVEDIAFVGHSMGGLVSRSALHAAESDGRAWRGAARTIVCIASPHHGAPLERGGHLLETLLEAIPYGAPFARLGRLRSAGVTDLRFGHVLDAHHHPSGRFARGPDRREELRLPEGVRSYAIAGTRTRAAGRGGGRLASDGLVPVASALGRNRKPGLTLAFDDTFTAYGVGHIEVIDHPEVWSAIRRWLAA